MPFPVSLVTLEFRKVACKTELAVKKNFFFFMLWNFTEEINDVQETPLASKEAKDAIKVL